MHITPDPPTKTTHNTQHNPTHTFFRARRSCASASSSRPRFTTAARTARSSRLNSAASGGGGRSRGPRPLAEEAAEAAANADAVVRALNAASSRGASGFSLHQRAHAPVCGRRDQTISDSSAGLSASMRSMSLWGGMGVWFYRG